MANDNSNPFLNHRMPFGYELVVHLLPQFSGGPDIQSAAHKDPQLLKAVTGRSESAVSCINSLIQAIGHAQAIAVDTKELTEDTLVNLGWGIAFLGGLAEGLQFVRDHAEYHLKEMEVKS